VTAAVRTETGTFEAELYTVVDDGEHCPPSARYLHHILAGLEAAGHEPRVLRGVRAIAGFDPVWEGPAGE